MTASRRFPASSTAWARLVAAGKRVVLLSNAPRRADDVVRRIARIGVPAGPLSWRHVVGRGGLALPPAIAPTRSTPRLAGAVLHIWLRARSGNPRRARPRLCRDAGEADFILNTGPAEWDDTIEDYAPVLAAARARDLPMVCANPDLVVIHSGRPALCAGALAEHYERSAAPCAGTASPTPRSMTAA